MSKKLYRSVSNRMVCGVCGGIGEFLHIDATIIRLLWVPFSFAGLGILFYIIAAAIVPTEF